MNPHSSAVIADRNRDFERIRSFFDRLDRDNGIYTITAVGEFIPSSLGLAHDALQDLLSGGIIDSRTRFLDAGCGDARIVALASLAHGLESTGIEYDEEIFRRGRESLTRLDELFPGNKPRMEVLLGDFTDDETYHRAGRSFTEFGAIFNYINNHLEIAGKIAAQSPSGTRFLLYYPSPNPEHLDGLELEHSFVRTDRNAPDGFVAQGTAVHVYRKP